MQALRNLRLVRWIVFVTVASLGSLGTVPAFASAHRQDEANARRDRMRAAALWRAQGLPAGLTQTPDAKLRAKIAAKERAAVKPLADVRPLSAGEMRAARGRGPFRNAYFNGTLPWQRSFRDVNLCNGNLFKSFTDVQVAPGRGAGLVLQRTYNSNDARIGPFGVGWTHAYDIRVEESANVRAETGSAASSDPDSLNDVPRTDFFGGKHTYHRDADGLYSPPAYLYDEMSSEYDAALVNGPKVKSDTEKGMDGTIKHYASVLTLADGTEGNERACDSITDRHGNVTTLAYGQTVTQADGSVRKLLTSVTDPTGRVLTFHWTNFGTTSAPVMRITEVDAPNDPATNLPVYKVAYGYYTDPSDPASYLNLHTATLDPDGLARTTSYTYAAVTGTDAGGNSATENGLLASITDPLSHTVSYAYALSYSCVVWDGGGSNSISGPTDTGTVWVYQITEPAGVDAGSNPRTITWSVVAPTLGHGAGNGDNRFVTDNLGTHSMTIGCAVDSRLRMTYLENCKGNNDYAYVGFDAAIYFTGYDDYNNVVRSDRVAFPALSGAPGGDLAERADLGTFGPHGNMLTHTVAADGSYYYSTFPGQDTCTYYNASKYFQKAGATDMNGHATAMDYFDDQDAAPGNRGEVAWVRDAGYSSSASPSYHKQFTYTYNQYGQKVTETNLNGVVTQYAYGDAWGNLTQVVQDPGGAGHLNRTTTMAYDVMGRVNQSTDPAGQTSTFTYNSLGQPLTVHTPAKGSSPAETVSYVYGANGRTESVTDNRGTTTMAYEAGCERVHSVTDPVTGTLSYTYTLTGERLTTTLPGGGTWTYNYWDPYADTYVLAKNDPGSAMLSLRGITDDQGRQVGYAFDGSGRLDSMRFNMTYDQSGSLVSYCETQYSYDAGPVVHFYTHGWLAGVRTSWHWFDTSGYGSQWRSRLVSENDYTYDNSGQRLANAVTAMAPGTSGAPQYMGGTPSYDSDGSVTNLVTTSRTEQYGYDAVNRLKTVDYGDGQTQAYAFDAMGNRTQRVDSVAGTTAYAFDNANRLTTVGAASYTNDADGNTLTGGGRTNAWDAQNRLVSSVVNGTTSAFTYGADGLRRSSTVTPSGGSPTTTRYAYDGQTMVRSLRQNGQGAWQAAATYLTGPRGMEYRRDDLAGTVRWYVYDGLGSVVGELDPSGNLTAGKKYDVYGAERQGGTGTSASRQGFCGSLGHVTDAETGLVYMRARYYDPNLGRFESEDPAKHGASWFVYCNDNPINGVDPSGLLTMIDVVYGGGEEAASEAVEARAAQQFGSWAENKIFQAVGKWAEKFSENWSEEIQGSFWKDGVREPQWEGDNFTVVEQQGKWRFRMDFSGHNDLDPHFNFGSDQTGGGFPNSWGNHAPISKFL